MRMAEVAERSQIGSLLGDWRERRRMSQLDLALEAGVSARHVSFIETGRSKPSAGMVMQLAEHLEVPLRDRNSLLLAAGYAPAYGQRDLAEPDMGPVRDAIDRVVRDGFRALARVLLPRRRGVRALPACDRAGRLAWAPPPARQPRLAWCLLVVLGSPLAPRFLFLRARVVPPQSDLVDPEEAYR